MAARFSADDPVATRSGWADAARSRYERSSASRSIRQRRGRPSRAKWSRSEVDGLATATRTMHVRVLEAKAVPAQTGLEIDLRVLDQQHALGIDVHAHPQARLDDRVAAARRTVLELERVRV